MLKQVVHRKPESEAEGAMRTPSARLTLASLSLSMLLSALGTSIANVALPTLAQALRASFQDVQWVVLAYLLAVTALVVSAGRLGDLVGRRRLLLAGIGLFTTASLFCGVAPTLWLLVAARATQGLGAAVMMALTMAYVGETVPKAKTGSAMGLLGTMSAVGTALGPSLGGILISSFGWRAIFLVNVPLGVLTFLLAYHTLPGDKATRSEGAGFDWKGTLLLALTLAVYALAMTVRGGGLNLTLLAAAGLGVGLFVLVEARAASPLIRLGMFRNPVLSAGLAMSALVMTVMTATLVVGTFYLARGLGLDAAVVGLVMSAGPVVAALTGIPAGRLVDHFGAGRMTKVTCRGSGRFIRPLHDSGGVRHPRVRRSSRRHHGRVCAVSGRQQHRHHDGHQPGPARGGVRNAESVAQPRARHRRVRHGCRIRARIRSDRHHDRAGRCRCHRDEGHVRTRRGSGPCSARHLRQQPRVSNTTITQID